jgi:TolB protein
MTLAHIFPPRFALFAPALLLCAPAAAQLKVDVTAEGTSNLKIAIPAMPAQQSVDTPAGSADLLGEKIAGVIAADLRGSGLFAPIGPAGVATPVMSEVTEPAYPRWAGLGAEALVQGYVRTAGGEANITVGCYLYDVSLKQELVRQGFVVAPRDWRRAAHRCSDLVYARLTGESPFFDSRIAYIAETGPKDRRIKRLAIMDSDGANHRFITNGQSLALTPRWSPDYKSIAYVSYIARTVRIYVYDVDKGRQTALYQTNNSVFAPRWSPDGRSLLFSMSSGGNTDIYRISASGGAPTRLTDSPSLDVGGSFSPDGRQIVFESDRSGTQQVYVMNADGSNQRRISFGGGRYGTPEWSPRGDLIAFTKIGGNFRVGVMNPDGSGERLLTNGWQDEAPTWSPNGRVLQFFRTAPGTRGDSTIWQVDLTGINERKIATPVDGSDPSWGPLLP